MRLWLGILLAVLIAAVPVLSSCTGQSEYERQQEYYRQVLEAYQKQQKEYNENYRKALEEYQKEMQKSYQAAADNLTEYYEKRTEQMQKQIEYLKQQQPGGSQSGNTSQ